MSKVRKQTARGRQERFSQVKAKRTAAREAAALAHLASQLLAIDATEEANERPILATEEAVRLGKLLDQGIPAVNEAVNRFGLDVSKEDFRKLCEIVAAGSHDATRTDDAEDGSLLEVRTALWSNPKGAGYLSDWQEIRTASETLWPSVTGDEKLLQAILSKLEKDRRQSESQALFTQRREVRDLLWLSGGDLTIKWSATTVTPPQATEAAAGRGVAPRNEWFLQQWEARGTDTYHRPKKVYDKWQEMKHEERAAICPEASGKVSHDAVVQGIKRARNAHGGKANKPATKHKRTARKA